MNLQQRFGILFNQFADAAGLGAAQILGNDPSRGEDHRIVGIGQFGGIAVRHTVEMRPAIRGLELAVFPQPRRARDDLPKDTARTRPCCLRSSCK